jgi:hypothetical protein
LGARISPRYFFAAQPRLLSLAADILQGPIDRLRGERFIDIENPNPLFLAQAGRAAHWAKNDLILGSFKFQRIPRRELQLVPQRLGQNHTAGFVECQSGIHNGISPYQLAFEMALQANVRFRYSLKTKIANERYSPLTEAASDDPPLLQC